MKQLDRMNRIDRMVGAKEGLLLLSYILCILFERR
jgi:hypothetical protein